MNLPSAVDLMPLLRQVARVDLYLDYDGTLAEFAPTPDDVLPDERVIDLITRLAARPNLRISIISGRRLAHIRKLLPVDGILLAGTYGVEMLTRDGRDVHRLSFDAIRPTLESLKPRWRGLIEGLDGFYLEDKGWALAIHGRRAEEKLALQVLEEAEKMLTADIMGSQLHKIHSYRFLEVGPVDADKGHALAYVFSNFEWEGSIPVYIGDDDKDEDAFQAVNGHDGISILVSREARGTRAKYLLDSPAAVHQWLKNTFL